MQVLLRNSSMCQKQLTVSSFFVHHETRTHTRLTALLPGLPRWAGARKVKPIWIYFTEARDSEWQWYQLGHMQVCTSLQTDNHASTIPLSFLQAGCPFCRPNNSVDNAHGNVVDNTVECWGELQRLLTNLNVLVATIKGMRAIKLCTYTVSQKKQNT